MFNHLWIEKWNLMILPCSRDVFQQNMWFVLPFEMEDLREFKSETIRLVRKHTLLSQMAKKVFIFVIGKLMQRIFNFDAYFVFIPIRLSFGSWPKRQMMPTPNDESGFENDQPMKKLWTKKKKNNNNNIIFATRIKLLLDAGLLSVFQHHADNNFIIVWFFLPWNKTMQR